MNWDIEEDFDEDDFYDALQKLKPDEFYFQLDIGNFGFTNHYFIITPKAHYDVNKCQIDTHISEWNTNIPSDFDEVTESTFVYNGDPQVGRQLLLQAGFIEKKMF